MADTTAYRSPTIGEAIVPIAGLVLLVSASYFLFGDSGIAGPTQVALVFASTIAVAIGRRCGHSLKALNQAAVDSVSSGIGAIFILFAVGALIGTWALSGTLVAMVYYGLHLLSPTYFYATAALVCAFVSACIGTSWTTVGTVGIGLMGISEGMGLDPAISAAAIISGSYFGDTTSPLSDTTNLAAGVGGSSLYEHLWETGQLSVLALMAALAFFWSLGIASTFDPAPIRDKISGAFHVSLFLFLPLLLVVILAVYKFPPFTAIFSGAIAGGILAVLVAPERVIAFSGATDLPASLALLKGVWLALAGGYKASTGIAPLDELASRGGMASMLNTIWLVIAALAFGGIVEKAGILQRLIAPLLATAQSTRARVAALVAAIVATNAAAGDQYVALVLPARLFKSLFAANGEDPVVLTRTVSASATPTSALIPWNSCGAYMSATLGVGTLSYAPYAVFNYAMPIIAILLATRGPSTRPPRPRQS